MSEFNLWDNRIIDDDVGVTYFAEEDLREFVKLIKEDFSKAIIYQLTNTSEDIAKQQIDFIIDNRVGNMPNEK